MTKMTEAYAESNLTKKRKNRATAAKKCAIHLVNKKSESRKREQKRPEV